VSPERFLNHPVGIITNVSKPNAVQATVRVIEMLKKHELAWRLEQSTAESAGVKEKGLPLERMLQEVSWIIAIGGDGTILQTARNTAHYNLPLLGVNPGLSFGFMTDTPIEELSQTLDDIYHNNFDILQRSTLQATYWKSETGAGIVMPRALNDVTFIHGAQARLIELEVSVNGNFLTTYAVDGLIFATATGSTAHSMSAGGPILFPTTEAFVMTPICPHTLTNRPIIIPRGGEVEVRVGNGKREVHVAIDGQVTRRFARHDHISLKLGDCARFIQSRRRSFVTVLQKKLHWRGHLRSDAT
jgi:NAD+ kinase